MHCCGGRRRRQNMVKSVGPRLEVRLIDGGRISGEGASRRVDDEGARARSRAEGIECGLTLSLIQIISAELIKAPPASS